MTNIEDDISNYPCTVCMGFCLEDENCILCNICNNWFHKECVNLSNEKFRLLSNNINSKFTCTICVFNKKCEVCNKNQNQSRVRFLYCVTCLNHFCDDCNPFLSDEIDKYRLTDEPFYCPSCAAFYPCGVCGKHCYHDTVHQPFITCTCCNSRIHTKCSKLTRSQSNKTRLENSYICSSCVSENLPFAKLSKNVLENTILVSNSSGNTAVCPKPINHPCMLCVQCNNECEECTVCPDNHRLCPDCTTKCSYLGIRELNDAFLTKSSNDMAIIYANIRSLNKNLGVFELMLNRLDRKPDVICITETRLYETIVAGSDSNEINLRNYNANEIKLPGYKFYHTVSTTSAGGAGLYVSDMCEYKIRNDLDIKIEGECEAKFVEIITANKNAKNVIVGSIYRHPHDNHPEFLSDFSG